MKIKTTLLIYLNTLTKYHLLAFTYNNIAEHYDFINGHNFVTNTIGINALRSQAVQNIFGDVLEVGAGTGIQSDSYNWHTIKKYTAIDNSAEMLARLKHRILAGAPANNRVENNNFFALAGDANDIPLPSSNVCMYNNFITILRSVLIPLLQLYSSTPWLIRSRCASIKIQTRY